MGNAPRSSSALMLLDVKFLLVCSEIFGYGQILNPPHSGITPHIFKSEALGMTCRPPGSALSVLWFVFSRVVPCKPLPPWTLTFCLRFKGSTGVCFSALPGLWPGHSPKGISPSNCRSHLGLFPVLLGSSPEWIEFQSLEIWVSSASYLSQGLVNRGRVCCGVFFSGFEDEAFSLESIW